MYKSLLSNTLEKTVDALAKNYLQNSSSQNFGAMPSKIQLKQIVEIINEVIFPEYFSKSGLDQTTLKFYISGRLDILYKKLFNQIYKSLKFSGFQQNVKEKAKEASLLFIDQIPEIGRLLWLDIQAIYNGDPAAKSKSEIILCYPSVVAIIHYRAAHELLKLQIPYIPRIIAELAHSETGIDIHPGAKIGESFCIDHGTGVVIGETCIIGNYVKIYQGVTLGAKRFELDENGNPIKDIPRHPIIEDNVTIYANATVLGRITVGKNSVIGSNVWITKDVSTSTKSTISNVVDDYSI